MKKQILLIAFILLAGLSYGQTINPKTDTVEWEYTSLKNLNNQQEFSLSGKFIVYPSSRIDWAQKEGEEIFSMDLNKISGSWTDAQTDGTVQYTIASGQSAGTLKISKAGDSLTLELKLVNPGRPSTWYLFYANSFSRINN